MLRDSSGTSVSEAFLTLQSRRDVICDQQRLSSQLNERIQQLTAERDEASAPLDLATMVHRFVPLSARAPGTLIIFYSCS